MHFTHIKLKPTQRFEINIDPRDTFNNADIPEESEELVKSYKKSKKLLDDYNKDLTIVFDNELIFGFDFLHDGQKFIIPEINPTTIFYSNAVMSHKKLIAFREELYKNSPTLNDFQKPINPNHFGDFFKLASNCIINLQSTLESFANRVIPDKYEHIDKLGNKFEPSIFHKLDSTLPIIKNKKFNKSHNKNNQLIRKIIELRNDIIHLKPIGEHTNTQYKKVYRRLLKFDYTKAIISVKKLVNFYEPSLLEECECGKELYYDVTE